MLAVVSALVGFHGWPAGAVGETVRSVPLQPTPQPVLSAVREVRTASLVREHGSAVGRRVTTAGLVKVVPVSAPRPVGYPVALTPGHAGPAAPAPPPTAAQHSAPVQPPATPPTDPQQLQSLVSQVIGSAPPPPAQPGGQLDVSIPILGGNVTAPAPATAQ